MPCLYNLGYSWNRTKPLHLTGISLLNQVAREPSPLLNIVVARRCMLNLGGGAART